MAEPPYSLETAHDTEHIAVRVGRGKPTLFTPTVVLGAAGIIERPRGKEHTQNEIDEKQKDQRDILP